MNDVMTIGLDLAKNTFYAVALNARGKRQWRKKLTRKRMRSHFARMPACRIAMEAYGSAHYWARKLKAQGHEVLLLPPQHVKGYLHGLAP